jgi:hypothetical protein
MAKTCKCFVLPPPVLGVQKKKHQKVKQLFPHNKHRGREESINQRRESQGGNHRLDKQRMLLPV